MFDVGNLLSMVFTNDLKFLLIWFPSDVKFILKMKVNRSLLYVIIDDTNVDYTGMFTTLITDKLTD